MAAIIGQEKLRGALDSYRIDTMPKTLMLIGEPGCGKHLLSKALADRLGLAYVIIGDEMTHDDLISYSQSPTPTMYVIEISKFSEKQQNQFLKFIEEPAKCAFVMVLADSEVGVLPTISNRCLKLFFERYTDDQLKSLMPDPSKATPDFLAVCNTPGRLKAAESQNVEGLLSLCDSIVANIGKTSWANALKLVTKVNCGDENDRFDFDLFFNALELAAFKAYKNGGTDADLAIYELVNKAKKDKANKSISKDNFMLSFVTSMWKETNHEADRA